LLIVTRKAYKSVTDTKNCIFHRTEAPSIQRILPVCAFTETNNNTQYGYITFILLFGLAESARPKQFIAGFYTFFCQEHFDYLSLSTAWLQSNILNESKDIF